jgi:hypothetical protein
MANTHGRAADAEAEALRGLCDPERFVAVMFTIGRYLAHSAICNTLRLAPPVASPLGAKP